MTDSDMKLMRKLGIVPCRLGEAPSSSPPQAPAAAPIPKLTHPIAPPVLTLDKDDVRLLNAMKVEWLEPVERDYVAPQTLKQYLYEHPCGFRTAVRLAAEDFGYDVSPSNLVTWEEGIIKMFQGFEKLGLEDVVEMYVTAPPRRPDQSIREHFDAYIEFRVWAALPVLIRNLECEANGTPL
jgi:hypothetical protein